MSISICSSERVVSNYDSAQLTGMDFLGSAYVAKHFHFSDRIETSEDPLPVTLELKKKNVFITPAYRVEKTSRSSIQVTGF